MPKILQSYQKGELALEDWTDDMLTTLPGWSGWMYNTYNIYYSWEEALSEYYTPIGLPTEIVPAGGSLTIWGHEYKVFTAGERNNAKLIAHRPYLQANGWYYIRGDLKFADSVVQQYSIARCTSIPGA